MSYPHIHRIHKEKEKKKQKKKEKRLRLFSLNKTSTDLGKVKQIEAYVTQKIDFAFETTLSGVAYLSRLKQYKKKGYKIHLFFLWIPDVKLSLARVAARVKMGGHNISEKVVRRRFHKGIKNFFSLYETILDSWMLFDNSENAPRLIAEEKMDKIIVEDAVSYKRILELAEAK